MVHKASGGAVRSIGTGNVVPCGEAVTIGLVGCGKKKLAEPARARDLYVGPLFTAAAAYAEAAYDHWFILSARHYLVHPTEVLDPYTTSMRDRDAISKRAWGATVECDLRCGHGGATQGRHDWPRPTIPRLMLGKWLVEGQQLGRRRHIDVYFHAGRDYTEPILAHMRQLGRMGAVTEWEVHLPVAGLGIGEQRRWYAERRGSG